MAHVISIYNFKGGVGKTTTSINLAFNWSTTFRVLLIDADPQCNLTSTLAATPAEATNLYDLTKRLLHNSLPEVRPVKVGPYLDLIPGSYNMTEFESNSQFVSFGDHIYYRLFQLLKPRYDLIIVDCPTYFGTGVKSVINNSSGILIPAIPDSFSWSGIKKLLTYFHTLNEAQQVAILGIFFNQVKAHTLLHQEVIQHARTKLKEIVCHQVVRDSIKVSEANRDTSTYQLTDHQIHRDFSQLSSEVISRMDRIEIGKAVSLLEEEQEVLVSP